MKISTNYGPDPMLEVFFRGAMIAYQEYVAAWQNQTFPQATAATVLSHIKEESEELQTDPTGEECADVFFLLIGLAHKQGFSLADAITDKLAINRARTWDITAPAGHTKHSDGKGQK